ncbi:MAG: hypothetical protein KAS23_16300 [Anaerohalosphaera sp.]|nr:hypothetical protein [Anaerohalosphaera sp.]
MSEDDKSYSSLPKIAADYIKLVVRSIRYRRKVRNEVRSELIEHFIDALNKCTSDKEKQTAATKLITEFGDPKLLAVLIRRGKIRCRPLWKKVISVTLRSFLAAFVLFIVYMIWFINGKPNPETDYLARLNDSIKPAISDGDNAWTNYEKALSLYVEPDDQVNEIFSTTKKSTAGVLIFSQLPEQHQLLLRQWIASNDQVWAEYQLASQKQYRYRYTTDIGDDRMLIAVLLPHLGTIRDIAKDVGLWRIRIAVAEGNVEGALSDSLTLMRVGKQWQGRGLIIEQLVGMAICDIGINQMLSIIDSIQLSKELLIDVKQRVEGIFADGYPMIDISAERLVFLDIVQYTFTDSGSGGGHLIPNKFHDLFGFNGQNYDYPWVVAGYGLLHAGRDETVKKGLELYERLEKNWKLTPYQREHQDISDDQMFQDISEVRYSFVRALVPALARCYAVSYQKQTYYEALVTVLSIELYKIEKRHYPVELGELVAEGYLDRVPDDPYSDSGLIYRQTDDSYKLYSVSENFIDDGGEPYKDKNGKVRLWKTDGGDAVFWPVP